MLPTVFLVSLIVFFLIRLIPGDIIDMMLEHTSGAWGIEQIDRAEAITPVIMPMGLT